MTTNETLFKAVETGNPENVKMALLTEKINSASYYGAKSVIFATEKEHIEILEMLLENGSKVPRPSFWANSYNIATSTLPKAAKSGRVDIVRLLLSYGAAFNKQQLNDVFFDAFALALKSGNLEMIKALINAGANVNLKNKHGVTPLILAILVQSESQEIIECLLNAGANVNAKEEIWEQDGTKRTRTPLTFAKQLGNEKLIELLNNAKKLGKVK